MKSDKSFNYIDMLQTYEFREEKILLSQIESLLINENSEGILIAIKGDWGSGKTSTIKMLQSYFRDFHECNAIFYEAWKYHSEENPLIPLLTLLSEQFPKSQTLKTFIKKSFSKYANNLGESIVNASLNYIGVTEAGQSELKDNYKEIKKHIEEILNIASEVTSKEISEFDKQFNKIKSISSDLAKKTPKDKNEENRSKWEEFIEKREIKKQLFIFVDDLDRLMPKDAIKLFEAIRFYLKIPNSVVIMGVNDKILSEHILTHYRLGNHSQDEEFLEKLFDFSYELNSKKFDSEYMLKFHFDKIDTVFHEKLKDFFERIDLDSLTHRKWKKLANRIYSELMLNSNFDKNRIKIACFKELFPKSERFVRNFNEFMQNIVIGRNINDDVISEFLNILESDRAFFYFPKKNFDKLFEIEGQVSDNI